MVSWESIWNFGGGGGGDRKNLDFWSRLLVGFHCAVHRLHAKSHFVGGRSVKN